LGQNFYFVAGANDMASHPNAASIDKNPPFVEQAFSAFTREREPQCQDALQGQAAF
jgi:hypothetical protein